MKCADDTCPYWEKDKDCPSADGCAGYIDKIPCTQEEMERNGCTEWCGLPFCKSDFSGGRRLNIGLHDAERDHLKHKSFPNYAIMKISAWHKSQGDTVEWWNPLYKYDLVYSSKVFDFTPVDPYLPEDAVRGGTGYRDIPMDQELPEKIDNMFPDYSIYPECDYAIGYLTRGCPNHCRWCVVPKKEGGIRPYRAWENLVRTDTNKLMLMDNNILSCQYGIEQLESLIGSGYSIDLNQGIDARLVDERIAEIISQLKWIRFIRFSCDQRAQIEPVRRAVELLMRHGVKPYRIFIYLLVTSDLKDASERVEALKRYKAINLYAQAERNERLGILPNKLQLEFQQRYVYGGSYRKETWEEYCKRKKLAAG